MNRRLPLVFLALLLSALSYAETLPALLPAPQSTDSNYWWNVKRAAKLKEVKEKSGSLVVFYGDSITELWEWQDRGKDLWIKNFVEGPYKGLCLGYSADCTQHLLFRLENGETEGLDPKVVVLQIGTNNSWLHPEYPAADTVLAVSAILGKIQESFPDAKVILCPVPPCGELPEDPRRLKNAVVNAEIEKFADGKEVFWLDWSSPLLLPDGKVDKQLFYDFVHPTKEGYERWFKALKPLLDEFLGFNLPGAPEAVVPASKMEVPWWRQRLLKHRETIMSEEDGSFDAVLCGDSITHFWEQAGKDVWKENFGDLKTLNLGYSGDRTQHLLWRLKNGELDGYKAGNVILMIGTNNTEDPPEDVAAGIKAALAVIREKQPEARVILMPIFPRDETKDSHRRLKNEKVNEMIKEYADGQSVVWLDINAGLSEPNGDLSPKMFPDLLHPSEAGYRVWAESLRPYLKKSE